MMDEAKVTKQVSPEMERLAEQRARERAKAARWDIDVAAFFFSILILVTILMFQGTGIEFVGPVAVCGLVMGWLVGWSKGKQKYKRYYDEELSKLEQESEEGTVWGRMKEQIKKELEKELEKELGKK